MSCRRLLAVFLVLAVVGVVAPVGAAGLRVGVVLSLGGLGDRSFNDAAYLGVQKLREIPGCQVDVLEPSDIEAIAAGLEFFCQRRCDLIIGVGLFANEPLRRVAQQYPQQSFALLDSVVTLPNVLSIIFNEEEGSFYAGALAGLLTRTNRVGFLGGMKSPVVNGFERGYKRGVRFVNPQAELVVRYAGETPEAFNSPKLGETLGGEIAAEKADIVYHAAGRTGMGLIQSARRHGYLVIGVDSDQNAIVPGKIAASMVKRLDVAMDRAARLIMESRFKGCVLTLGLVDGGIDLTLSKFNRALFTPILQERLKEVEQFLLHPPATTPDEPGAVENPR
ncbi:MAG TPA: BMP family ABC transporter substrate-binding protein [Candidatus Ozemobacteraceae bacterium]|nr:BMP family ABC transporter substrate-binding protein [Candidatus Ozemobacteraceae bacterium]